MGCSIKEQNRNKNKKLDHNWKAKLNISHLSIGF